MKRAFSMLLALVLLLGVLPGCGQSEDTAASPEPEPVELAEPSELPAAQALAEAVLPASGKEEGLEVEGLNRDADAERLAAYIEAMTDLEMETAAYGWLVDNVNYDWTLQDALAETDRRSYGPYGGLVNRAAVCLGYAASFQLLMDMSGVECITVVGACFNSTGDHAWNMVKLNGEWYCVDVTWDDPVFSGNPVFYPSQWLTERHHKYFNVTSDYMRETDHQWDYDNTPEATATAYSWSNLSGQ